MFVFSCKTTKTQIFWTAVCVLLMAVLLVTAIVSPARSTAAVAVSDANEGIAYLRTLGYEAEGGEAKEIQLPETLDGTLAAYNALLKTMGMDLTPYLGKRVQYRTYTITNHPSGNAIAHLYLYQNTVIGGDLTVNGVPGILKER